MIESPLERLRKNIFGFRETIEAEVRLGKIHIWAGKIGTEANGLAGFRDSLFKLPK